MRPHDSASQCSKASFAVRRVLSLFWPSRTWSPECSIRHPSTDRSSHWSIGRRVHCHAAQHVCRRVATSLGRSGPNRTLGVPSTKQRPSTRLQTEKLIETPQKTTGQAGRLSISMGIPHRGKQGDALVPVNNKIASFTAYEVYAQLRADNPTAVETVRPRLARLAQWIDTESAACAPVSEPHSCPPLLLALAVTRPGLSQTDRYSNWFNQVSSSDDAEDRCGWQKRLIITASNSICCIYTLNILGRGASRSATHLRY